MAIGLYPDLALGSAHGGAETWGFRDLFAEGASLGAPPDEFSPEGQDWAIPPLDPLRLHEQGFAFFRRLLRAAFAHAGALRIDHVLGLFRLYWIPHGRPPSEGAYVRQPARELLAILAQESSRQGALVIGEDLGTVPPGTPARLARHGILSSRVLYFEREGAGFRPARAWSRRALATANTHDLVPLAGYAAGTDLVLRRRARAIPSQRALQSALAERAASARALEDRLIAEGLLRGPEPGPRELAVAVSGFLSRTPCPLVALSLDDAVGESDAGEPSWCRTRAPPELDPAPVDSARAPAGPPRLAGLLRGAAAQNEPGAAGRVELRAPSGQTPARLGGPLIAPVVAYFSMEIALEAEIPTYAGGLGVLAGDTIRSAADLGLPLVAVSLVHRHGYFHQQPGCERRAVRAGRLLAGRGAARAARRTRARSRSRGAAWRSAPGAIACAASAATRCPSISSTPIFRRTRPRIARSRIACTAATPATGSARKRCSGSAACACCARSATRR